MIRSIHLQTTNGRRRFAKFAGECFHKLLTLLTEEPDLDQLLTDEKPQAPARYLAAVEEGLRTMGKKSDHTMGGGAILSKEKWRNVAKWRKREVLMLIIECAC